ncbi:hypothetical protein UlMin_006891 [Ulmus minor]
MRWATADIESKLLGLFEVESGQALGTSRHCAYYYKKTKDYNVSTINLHVICSLCGTEQEVQQVFINCGVCIGKYFCNMCKLFDDDVNDLMIWFFFFFLILITKRQYHCNGCGICRIEGSQNFFHCHKCCCCYSILLKNSHPCVEGVMHHDCPVCFEFLFESRNNVTIMPCRQTIHTNLWEKFDMEIASTPMPEPYQNKLVWILCNDCGNTLEVHFHVVAQKCPNCKSYNTRQTIG